MPNPLKDLELSSEELKEIARIKKRRYIINCKKYIYILWVIRACLKIDC